MSLKEEIPKDPENTTQEKISQEEYEAALAILEKQKEAKETVEKFEAELKYEDDPILEIVEKGVKSVISFEEIPGRNICRVTEYRYDFDGKSVIQKIEYLENFNSVDFLTIKNIITQIL